MNDEGVCRTCGKGFARKAWLRKHVERCGRRFVCDRCQKAFARKQKLVEHVRREHAPGVLPTIEPVASTSGAVAQLGAGERRSKRRSGERGLRYPTERALSRDPSVTTR